MMTLRPSAAAYARVAYALELQGHLPAALDSMKLAAAATAPSDREGLAWTQSQVGELNLQLGRLHDAGDAFIAASEAFPGHPFAVDRLRQGCSRRKGTAIGRCICSRICRSDRRRLTSPRGSAIC